jgi:hypothetical protein
MDCVLTAIIALAFWRANGRIRLDQVAMLHNVAEWCLRNASIAVDHVDPLFGLQSHMLHRMTVDI